MYYLNSNTNPFFQQKELRKILDRNNVKLEAYRPLGHGDEKLLLNPVISEIGKKHKKNNGQVILRFEIQEGFIVIPKSMNPERIAGNLDIFDFELSEDEMQAIRNLDTGKGQHDPEMPGLEKILLEKFKIHD